MVTSLNDENREAWLALLAWHHDLGVVDACDVAPTNLYEWDDAQARLGGSRTPPRPKSDTRSTSAPLPPPVVEESASLDEAIKKATETASGCNDFDALNNAVASFDLCPLRASAKNTVFTDGTFGADLMVIGEAPGRDEDRIGRPFVGRAGQLLDRMLASIGRSREENALISNVIFWRPPGNRTPTREETLMCRPFVERLIELSQPKAILLVGGAPLQAMLGVTGIMRARGVWRELKTAGGQSYPALPTFHPAYLLRQPTGKKFVWSDLQSLRSRLTDR